mmetsp:Transcript_30001/g.39460  ORF Transcript_30001/g.39460 Transcript_30001/m.39460 type:complete len:236 (-) Transcript_30001:38-745(-)
MILRTVRVRWQHGPKGMSSWVCDCRVKLRNWLLGFFLEGHRPARPRRYNPGDTPSVSESTVSGGSSMISVRRRAPLLLGFNVGARTLRGEKPLEVLVSHWSKTGVVVSTLFSLFTSIQDPERGNGPVVFFMGGAWILRPRRGLGAVKGEFLRVYNDACWECWWTYFRADLRMAFTNVSSSGQVRLVSPNFGWLDRHKGAPVYGCNQVRAGIRLLMRHFAAAFISSSLRQLGTANN